jgi:glycosyltransferase involved in cell wall biosynthesis
MKIYYVANARMPTEKAHGIQLAKMCEAFITLGHDVVLIVPTRGERASLQAFYNLRSDVPLVRISTPDFYTWGKLGYIISSCIFMFGSALYLFSHRAGTGDSYIYTVDIDTFSFFFLPLIGRCAAEMHTPKHSNIFTRFFFARARIIATNTLIYDALVKTFDIKRSIVESNGVDIAQFDLGTVKGDARAKLSLSNAPIALYVGRFYDWKGLDTLIEAAGSAPEITWIVVGGSHDELQKLTTRSVPANLVCVGSKVPSEIPLWLAAADALIILGTKRNEDSYRFTSPMKVFEYAAARRPIVASATPALRSILGEAMALWYEPDDAAGLASAVRDSIQHPPAHKIDAAYQFAQEHSWMARGKRIIDFMHA